MGNYITVKQPISETSFNYLIIERSLYLSGFSAITSQLITNNTYYDNDGLSTHWYRIKFQDTINDIESTYSDSFKADNEYYCTPREVASFIGYDQFTDSTNPTRYEVEDIISRICDEIDKRTHHSWRSTRVTNEYYDVRIQDRFLTGRYSYDYSTRIGLYLKHKKIRQFVSGTHKIEYWSGSDWVDFVSTYTEGRDQDYWVDYDRGIVYFVNRYPLHRRSNVRLTYDYGDTIIPGDITRAAILLTCADIMQKQDLNIIYPSSTLNFPGNRERWQMWQEEADKIIRRREEILSTRFF